MAQIIHEHPDILLIKSESGLTVHGVPLPIPDEEVAAKASADEIGGWWAPLSEAAERGALNNAATCGTTFLTTYAHRRVREWRRCFGPVDL